MPIYEFLCERCGHRFEELVDPGVEAAACRSCGARETHRVYSAQRAPFKIVKTAGETRKQERGNAQLREGAKQRFSAARARNKRGGDGG